MTRDIVDINDFTILVETGNSQSPTVDACHFDEPVIAVAFYGSGNVHLNVKYNDKLQEYDYTKGLALSFYGDEQVVLDRWSTVSQPRPALSSSWLWHLLWCQAP